MIWIYRFERCLHYVHGRCAGRGSSKLGVISLELKINWQGEYGQNYITEGLRIFQVLEGTLLLCLLWSLLSFSNIPPGPKATLIASFKNKYSIYWLYHGEMRCYIECSMKSFKKICFFTFLPLHSKMTWIRQRNGCKITHLEFRRLNTVTKVLKDKDKVSTLGKLYFVTFEGKVNKRVLIVLTFSLSWLVLWFQMNSKIWLNIILYSNGNRILVCLLVCPSPTPRLSLYQYLKWVS